MYWQLSLFVVVALVAVGGSALALRAVLLWRERRGRRLHERLDHLSTAMALLADTMESSLRDMTMELSRLSSMAPAAAPASRSVPARTPAPVLDPVPASVLTPPPALLTAPAVAKARTATRRRVKGAAKLGRPIRDIAAAERLSEGEVRLMVQMSRDQASRMQVTEQAGHAKVR